MDKDIFIKLLAQREFKAVRSILDVMNEVDIASLLSTLSDKELALAFRLIPKDKAAEVFSNMDTSMQTYLVTMFTEKELKELLDDLYMDDTVDMLEELPANLVKRILATVSASDRSMINQLLNYPEDSAGSIMTTEYVDLREEMTVGQAMAHIKKTGIHKETIYTCYITERRKLVGIVSAKDLMTTDDNVPIKDLMETEIISVYTHADQEQVAQLFTKYDLLALPVIDQDGRMVGIVTFDDAMDVMVDEATEDITKMAAINPSEKTYFETSVLQHAKNRIPWLLILMFTSIITGTIITRYENAFAAIPLLVSFIPMLMDTGGNCGSQSATLIIRGIALDEIRFTDLFKVMFKEFRISLIVGAFLAVANGVRIFIQYHNPGLAVVIACSLMGTVIMAKLVGCILPLLAKKFDDAMDVMVDEATEDITKMAAINPSEKTYFETSVLQHAKNRIPWLLILMFTSIITGTIITRYENAFAAIPLLVSFIPMLMDTGGNCGSQSATLIIRGIALDEIRFTDLFKVMFKEFRISLIVGAFLAVANGVRIFIQYHNPGLAVVIACSLMGTVIMAKLVGCILPLLAKKVNLDPAIMASPLITTLVDTFSILIYFNIATVLFRL